MTKLWLNLNKTYRTEQQIKSIAVLLPMQSIKHCPFHDTIIKSITIKT